MNCKFCGSPINEGASFCTNCGTSVNTADTSSAATPMQPTSGVGTPEAIATLSASVTAPEAVQQPSSYVPEVAHQPSSYATSEVQPIDAYSQVNGTASSTSSVNLEKKSVSSSESPVQNSYSQPTSYGQQSTYSQPTSYGQQNSYAQPTSYGQQNTYGQQNSYGQQGGSYYGGTGYNSNSSYGSYQSSPAQSTYPAYNVAASTVPDNSTSVLVLGIISVVMSFTVYFGLASLICGPIALAKAAAYKKSHNGMLNGKCKAGMGTAIGGIVLAGIITLILVIAVFIAIVEEL